MTTVLKAKWQQLENHGESPYPRHGYRAVALNEDLLIIHGGGDGRYVYRDLFILQPSTGEWRKIAIPSLPERAGFGLALINNNMYMFGGMSYNRKCLNDLYYLSLTTWKWDLLLPNLAPGTPPPFARVGHSFTRINDHLILMFAGVTEPAGHMMYLNDLYSLILESDDFCTWRLINAQCLAQPPARESHSACLYKPGNSGEEKLIIYGGSNGHRLDDVWSLDISTYTWSQYSIPWGSNAPPARSMHAATIAGSRMFVFGGWTPSDKHTNNDDFISPKRLCCFNLSDKKWEKLDEQSSKHTPYPRTGHSMVVVQDKIYMWSGRTGSHYHDDVTVLDDLWSLQVTPQKVVNRLILSNKTETMIKVEWDPVPLASYYILQIQVMPMANPESPTGLFSSSLNQISNCKIPIPAKLSKESSKPNISKSNTGQVSIPIPRKNNLVPIPVKPKINTYQCLSPKFSTKVSTPVLSTALSNTIANQVSAPKVSVSTKNNSTKTSTVALNFSKNKNSIPIVTTRVCFSKEKSSSNTSSRIQAVSLPTPDIPISVINAPVTHTTSAKHVIHTPGITTLDTHTPVPHIPSAKHVIHTPCITSLDIHTPVTHIPSAKHVIHTPGITTLDIHTPVTHTTATPDITNLDIHAPVTHTTATPCITTLDILTPVTHTTSAPGITVSDIQTPGSSYTPVIYTSASVTPIPPHRSTLETFLKPKPILSRPSSVKLMRSSTGRPVAVVPKSLIPNRTIACGTKPSNIVIVARKRPFI